MTSTRARETRVLTALLRDTGLSARDALDALDTVTADDDTWTQLRLWLAFTADDEHVALRFRVDTGRPYEVVGAWGGLAVDRALIHTGERLVVVRADDDENRCANECVCTPEERDA
jgi:hypothetical protein